MRIRRPKIEAIKETQMISLADIAFLIIFFFMLTSTFMQEKGVRLPVLSHSDKTDSPITVTLDAKGHISLNGRAMGSPGTLQTELHGMLSTRTSPKDCEVRLECDKQLTYKDYRKVYESISHAGGVIAIMHELRR
jgi:biopolymer transport protein ExbD